MSDDFCDRLRKCVSKADLTTADLARWFDRPFATVRTWVNGRTPRGPAGRLAEINLQRLVWSIRHDKGFPVPRSLNQRERINYILERRDGASRNARIPTVRPST